jgi:hypothetical protein
MKTATFRINSFNYFFWRRRGLSAIVPLLFAGLYSIPLLSQGITNAKRAFTVRDSIELTHIVNAAPSTTPGTPDEPPAPEPIYSPDGRYFLMVTLRGELRTNCLQGTVWMFDSQSVRDYISRQSTVRPEPKKLVVVSAISNVPVISDVRWIQGSKKISFLAKNGDPYQRLFLLDLESGLTEAITPDGLYVTGYDMKGDAIAYTTLLPPHKIGFDRDMLPIEQRTVTDLLYPDPPAIKDLTSTQLSQYPSALHLQKGGKEMHLRFSMDGNPIELHIPTLSLSSDGEHLITVASTKNVPPAWEKYQPNGEWFRLKAGPVRPKPLLAWGSMERPEQYVIVDLTTGSVNPLVEAPVGRDMGHYISTKAWWLGDNRHVVITNTYLPLLASPDKNAETQFPAVAVVDTTTKKIESRIGLRESPFGEKPHYSVADIFCDSISQEVEIKYKTSGDDPIPSPELYFVNSSWQLTRSVSSGPNNLKLLVRQSLDDPPTLRAEGTNNAFDVLIWDPNPQLAEIQLGKVAVDHWQDDRGRQWSGILAKPPNYDPGRRYPLVIQTHGYDANLFFTDGEYTTASGGRALAARGIIVLQMDVSLEHASTSAEGPDNLAGLISAINHLVKETLVDPKLVGVIGFSRTAYHVMFALTHRSDSFAAAVVTNGNFSYAPYLMWSSGGAPGELEREAEAINGGVPWIGENFAKWRANAPNFGLDSISTPLLITATERGELIPQWETFAGLRRLGKPVEMLWWWRQNTPHILVQPEQRYASQETVVDWFDFWLNRHEDADPGKQSQYLRWRELRKLVK